MMVSHHISANVTTCFLGSDSLFGHFTQIIKRHFSIHPNLWLARYLSECFSTVKYLPLGKKNPHSEMEMNGVLFVLLNALKTYNGNAFLEVPCLRYSE